MTAALRKMRKMIGGCAVLFLVAFGAACSSAPAKPGTGFRTLDATVVSRDFDPPGSGGASYRGEGNYYLVFEARDGEATATYKFQVTKTQYNRYAEGSHVRITLADNELRDIKPSQ